MGSDLGAVANRGNVRSKHGCSSNQMLVELLHSHRPCWALLQLTRSRLAVNARE
jgi:hypothetical protein